LRSVLRWFLTCNEITRILWRSVAWGLYQGTRNCIVTEDKGYIIKGRRKKRERKAGADL
jgi:hypothetical protein